jgi:hypothetical protein
MRATRAILARMKPRYLRRLLSLSFAVFFAGIASLSGASPQQADAVRRQPAPWDTCIYVEGKADVCKPGESPRKFEEYLRSDWLKQPVDGFSFNTGLDRLQPKDRFRAVWNEVGVLGASRIRQVDYLVNDSSVGAYLILAERRDGLFAPLLKWNGPLPEIKVYRPGPTGVLAFSRNFGGNIPMVRTWAWTFTAAAPLQLDLEQALGSAVQKVSSTHRCYDTEFEWETLHLLSWCWSGEWPGKPGVKDQINIWFDFKDGKLVPKQVELRNIENANGTKRWP